MSIFLVVVAIAVLVVLIGIAYYNSFVVKRNQADQAFSTIDVMLQKRADLVPNLVAAVQRYMQHEAATLERITQLRGRVGDAKAGVDERVQADNEMSRLLGGIFVQVEKYPDLKADKSFSRLQETLSTIEEQLVASRRSYNAAVTAFNNAVHLFPGNLVAGLFGFHTRALLQIPSEARANPDVQSLFKR